MTMVLALAWSQLRTYPARLIAIVAAVTLATGFLAATATFAATSSEGLRRTAAAPLTTSDIVLDADETITDPRWYEAAAAVPGIRSVDPQYARTVTVFGGSRRGAANVQSVAATPEVRWFALDRGAWPAGPGEVVADQRTLDDLGVDVGAELTFRQGAQAPVPVTVTGAADLGFRPLTGSDFRFYADPAFFAGDVPAAALSLVDDPSRLDEVLSGLRPVLGPGITAGSAASAADQAAARFAGGNGQLVVLMLAFATVALLAAVLVIANTFHVIVVQRVRQIALLRLVGGRRKQVNRVVLVEAAIAGVAGAVTGVPAGVGAGYLGADLLEINGGGLRVSLPMLFLCALVGVLATVLAAWLPARRATRIPPVRALQDAAEPPAGAVRGGPRLVVGVVVTAVGGALLAVAAAGASLPLAMAGGVLLSAGLLAALPRLIGLLLSPVARLLERFGVAAGLAGTSLSQNARRTASAAMAVVVGAALITALAVAATSGRATVYTDLEARYPVAAGLRTDGTAISGATVAALAEVDGLVASGTVGTVAARFPDGGQATPKLLAVPSAELAERVAPQVVDQPVVLLPAAYLAELGLADGAPITVTVGKRSLALTVRASRLADTTGQLLGVVGQRALGDGIVTTPTAVWGVAAAGFDRDRLAADVNAVAARDVQVQVGGGITEGGDIANVLAILLGLSVGMLAVTVVIALLGIANLLGLSVVERARELALLRALGTRRGRLRAMLAVEAVTITVLGTVAGVVVGVPVGLAGVAAAVGATADPVIRLPWGQLAVLVVAAVVTGVLASLLPARRAARVAPAEGLTR
ncbi:FtsX-like permease family protein [Actinoplanes rectilineatus]|uniref:FtsX-like permease family protein n=1 Tax=Actinoplanes rectilineatus TaxID=113571 RepID=UPI0006978461